MGAVMRCTGGQCLHNGKNFIARGDQRWFHIIPASLWIPGGGTEVVAEACPTDGIFNPATFFEVLIDGFGGATIADFAVFLLIQLA
jgi:hypothetical protein